MKTLLSSQKILPIFLFLLFVLTTNANLFAQGSKTTTFKDFSIVIEKTEGGIKLKSSKGSAWTDLSFSLNNYQPQLIDEFGMVKYAEESNSKDSNYADFLFTISKIDNEIILKGKQGTAWKDLSFTLIDDGKQAIDQFGMITMK